MSLDARYWDRDFETRPWAWIEAWQAQHTALFGKDYFPYGVEQSRKDIQALCDEQYAQGLVSQQVDAAIAFPEFEAQMSKGTAG